MRIKNTTAPAQSAVNYAQSNTCGANLTWRLSNGTLTISGTGNMWYYSVSNTPWYLYRSQITKVIIESGVTRIETAAFFNCSNLTSVSVPASVTSIGNSAFMSCYRLTSITIPEGITSIGQWVFYNCSSLTSVTIPSSITSIGNHAFHSCSKLKSITIPEGITNINRSVFTDCRSLTSVTIPESVSSIEERAFYGCSGLTDIYSLSVSPPTATNTNIFYGVDRFHICTLHVPAGSKQAYSVAEVWREFLNIEEDAPASVNVPLTATSINLYPNPVREALYIRSASTVRAVSIFDTAGNKVVAEDTYTGSIPTSTLPRGIYLVQIQTEDGMVTRRMMKE